MNPNTRVDPEGIRELKARNEAGEDIPPFALVKVEGSEADGTYSVYQPDEDNLACWAALDLGIADGEAGSVSRDWPLWVAYTGGTPVAGEEWGAASGSWYLTSGQTGFRIVGDPDTVNEIVQVEPVAAAASGSTGFFARLTDTSGGEWDFVRLKLSAGSYVDDGVETTGYPAVPLTIDGSYLCNPVADLRVWMIPSQQAGKYEFLPIGMADGTHPGLISLTTQTMGDGDKHFQQDVVIDQTLEVNADVIAGADVGGYGLPIFTVWATDGNGDDYPIIRVHQSTTNSVLLFGQDTRRPLNIYGWGGGVGFRATNVATLTGEGTTLVPATFQVYSVDYGSGDVRPQFSFSNGTNSREALVQINVLHPGSLPAVAAFDVQHAISCQAQYWCQGDEGLTEDVAIPGADGNTYTLHFTGGIYIGYDVDPTGT